MSFRIPLLVVLALLILIGYQQVKSQKAAATTDGISLTRRGTFASRLISEISIRR